MCVGQSGCRIQARSLLQAITKKSGTWGGCFFNRTVIPGRRSKEGITHLGSKILGKMVASFLVFLYYSFGLDEAAMARFV
jgi:hypothetical protein